VAGAIVTWHRLTRNFGWKLASLALAVTLWTAVVGEPELVTMQAVPVLYRNLPHDLLLLSDTPGDVQAELRGPSGRLTRATLAEVFAALDLSGVNAPGEQTFTLSAVDFSLPQGVTFLRAVPSQLRLRFDHLLMKDVPVQIRLKGMPPPGYRVTAQSVVPPQLGISGPESRVSGVQNAETDLVDITGMTQAIERRVNAFVADARTQFQSPPVVTVKIAIEKIEGAP
jgi:YbbR domain-containing protein